MCCTEGVLSLDELTHSAIDINCSTRLMLLSDQLAARRIAALMMIFVQLRKRHLPQRDYQAVSSVLPIDR